MTGPAASASAAASAFSAPLRAASPSPSFFAARPPACFSFVPAWRYTHAQPAAAAAALLPRLLCLWYRAHSEVALRAVDAFPGVSLFYFSLSPVPHAARNRLFRERQLPDLRMSASFKKRRVQRQGLVFVLGLKL